MSERPLVSVVVPILNSAAHLARCIESLLNQQGVEGSYEVILVDNGSTDGSVLIAERYPAVRLFHESERGAYRARNTGIRRAQARIISFIDSDCVASPNWLSAVLDAMQDPSTAIAVGHCRYPAEASTALRLLGAYENAKAEYVLTRCDYKYHFGYTNNMAVRATLFAELGLFREWERAGDSELVHRLAGRKPEMRTVFTPTMGVTHLEFSRVAPRISRLRTYSGTNAAIETFCELDASRRVGVLLHLIRAWTARSSPSPAV